MLNPRTPAATASQYFTDLQMTSGLVMITWPKARPTIPGHHPRLPLDGPGDGGVDALGGRGRAVRGDRCVIALRGWLPGRPRCRGRGRRGDVLRLRGRRWGRSRGPGCAGSGRRCALLRCWRPRQCAALLFLAGDLLREDVAVDVRGDGGEDQSLEFGQLQGFDLPLHRAARVKAVAAGEGQPPRVAALAPVAGSPYARTLIGADPVPVIGLCRLCAEGSRLRSLRQADVPVDPEQRAVLETVAAAMA
ncbi:hypothetical protein [Streptomyces sp. NPDC055709]